MDIKQLLQYTIDKKASDLHLIVGVPPTIRVDGKLLALTEQGVLTAELISNLLRGVLTTEQIERLSVNKEIDLSLAFSEKARFRVNVYNQKGSLAGAFRAIPLEIPQLDSLNLLVTGPTGHGKSTTLAAMLNEININRSTHIITIEDPIEFVFKPQKSVISQREMHNDTHSWPTALRSVLREDPDVVLVGEMRDYETMAATLTVAETGHLVFATLHTNSAAQTIDRIVDVFPEEQQKQIRLQLSNVLEAVFSMRLLPAITGGRVPAYEIMTATTAIKTAIREGKTHQIDSIIQTSGEASMNTLDAVLASLVRQGKITLDTAQAHSLHLEELNRLIRR
ncbi:MAG: twitching motility protein [Parcubacteria group bacterium GW2011_GWB1_45_10]|nr:MAG: twitching motility protein [Parcubacteria group bacterium GW2011_GWB1_45_10]